MFSKVNSFSSPFSKFSLQANFTKYENMTRCYCCHGIVIGILALFVRIRRWKKRCFDLVAKCRSCYCRHFGIVCQNKKVGKMLLGPGSHQCRESSLQELSSAPEMKETWKSNPQLKVFEWETLLHAWVWHFVFRNQNVKVNQIHNRKYLNERLCCMHQVLTSPSTWI